MSKLLIVGAGGHGKVVLDCARDTGRWQGFGFVDDARLLGEETMGVEVVGTRDSLKGLREQYDSCIVAVGANNARRTLLSLVRQAGFELPSLIHRHAYVSNTATLGQGTVVFAGAVVQAEARVGDGVIINTAATVDHDCVIGDVVHICPGVHLGGSVEIGQGSWVGIGSTVREGIGIGEGVVIGAGACVVSDVPSGVTAIGVPAKVVSADA